MKCNKCSYELNSEAKFCPECGTPAPKPEPVTHAKTEYPPILTIKQVLEFLQISRSHLYLLMRESGLPWFTIGAHKRFLTDEIIRWAKEQHQSKEESREKPA